jgi:two-component system chemotaxis response regulator CheB
MKSVANEEQLPGIRAVIIGASAGAVSALSVVLSELPRAYPLPIAIAVHLPSGHDTTLAELFGSRCRMQVKEAEDKEPAAGGTVYFAPPDYHLFVEKDGCLSLSGEEPVNFSRPSIDLLFETAADAYGPALLAIVLSGANHDGANGAAAVCAAGGMVLVQSPETAEYRAMPEAALAACPQARPMGLAAIAEFLQKLS